MMESGQGGLEALNHATFIRNIFSIPPLAHDRVAVIQVDRPCTCSRRIATTFHPGGYKF